MRTSLTGVALVWILLGASVAVAQPPGNRLTLLLRQIDARVRADPTFVGAEVTGARFVNRLQQPGQQLRLIGRTLTIEQRQRLLTAVLEIMQADPVWRDWLQVNTVGVSGLQVAGMLSGRPGPLAPPPMPAAELQRLRIRTLLRMAQDSIELDPRLGELDPRLGGVLLSDAKLERTAGQPVVLQLSGRVLTEDQIPIVQTVVTNTIPVTPGWQTADEIVVNVEQLLPSPPTQMFADRYYSLGLEYFWQGDYANADIAFMKALAEAPSREILRYWRVLTAIALGEDDRAEARLVPLLRRNPLGAEGPVIAGALERVQGPVRWKLMELEKNVLMTRLP